MSDESITGQSLIAGAARGRLLVSAVGLSFWGGVDPSSGTVIDRHHPLKGMCLTGKILAIPGGRGSCSGSGVMLELLLNGVAPAALVFSQVEQILTLGVLVAEVMFDRSIPVICIDEAAFAKLQPDGWADVQDDRLHLGADSGTDLHRDSSVGKADLHGQPAHAPPGTNSFAAMHLTIDDRQLLDGVHGKAAQIAMQILLRMARIQGADELIDITQAHIDACVYNGESSLQFAQKLVQWGARVRVPTTLNSISVDKRRWREQGIDAAFGTPASQLADAYIAMGGQLSFTCAPYLLDTAPKLGEQIVWAESNAVTFANSVIGARTQKYPDFLDACIALTGRAPLVGAHLDSGRVAALCIEVAAFMNPGDAFWPLLGYHIGTVAGNRIPLIYGLEALSPTIDNHKAFSAAFATTSSTPMYHIMGVTPEATLAHECWQSQDSDRNAIRVEPEGLLESWRCLNTATTADVDLICLGNPHFSLSECATLARLCSTRSKEPAVSMLVTLGRNIFEKASEAGYVEVLERFGVQFITDTCWCMLAAPVVPPSGNAVMTNSGKYAHYAPALVGRDVHFGGLAECVDVACTGAREIRDPEWLVVKDGPSP